MPLRVSQGLGKGNTPGAMMIVVALLAACSNAPPVPVPVPVPVPEPEPAPVVEPEPIPEPVAEPEPVVDPGTLPQTEDRPTADDPAFLEQMRGLLAAIDAEDPELARAAFFPRSAYVTLKDLPKPDRDWDTRLWAAYDRDLRTLHAAGPAGTLVRVEIPEKGVKWIVPGREYNTIGYWRVLGAKLVREVDGEEVSTRITSMISWRGRWYVVHLSAME